MRKRIASIVLSVCLCFTRLPTAAFAEEPATSTTTTNKTLMLGASGISGYDSTNGYDYIYFGNWTATDEYTTTAPIKWRVLDDQTNTGATGLFLLSDVLLGTGIDGGVYFQEAVHLVGSDEEGYICYRGERCADDSHTTCVYVNVYQGSDAQVWCSTFYSDNLTTQEQSAVLATTKSDKAFTSGTNVEFAASENILSSDKVFFLSAQEAKNSTYGFTDDAARCAAYNDNDNSWWLRSSDASIDSDAGVVSPAGGVGSIYAPKAKAVRPAFNLNLNSLLFTSAAENGKSGTVGALSAITDYDSNEWKLTLQDSARNFSVSGDTSGIKKSGDTITLNFSGATIYDATTAHNEYISVILEDSDGNATHYGRITQPTSTDGEISVTVPSGLADGTYKLHVFSEQYNDDKKTDYASAFQTVTLTVGNPPVLTAGTANRTSSTNADVTFNSDEAGTFYYAVVDSGAVAPSIDTTGAGTACIKGENTISLTTLTAGAKDIYIVAKDAAGNVSDTLTITIPAYVPPSGGSSDPTYSVTAPKADNGTVKVSPRYAEQGDTVTVTVTPDEGYLLDSLTVTDKNGNVLELKDLGNGKYSFKMPKGKVNVEATFVEDAEPLPSFADVPANAYYYDAVLWAAKNGVTGGVDENHFAPNEPCSRAQLVTFLWRAAGQPEASGTSGMTDVSQTAYYADAVAWAFENGIVGGYGNGLFGSDDTITREQMAVILYRFAQATGMDTTQGGMSVREYQDFDNISDYAVAAIQWAVNAGIMQGNNGNLMPGQPCTRAQIVTMLYRLLGE